jgi:CXXX repeat modification system protein
MIMKEKKKVGQVTPEEKEEILRLLERRNGLSELAKIVTADNDDLYEKLVKDMGDTSTKFQSWWDRMATKYQWESIDGGNWEINFETCEIYLVGGK